MIILIINLVQNGPEMSKMATMIQNGPHGP